MFQNVCYSSVVMAQVVQGTQPWKIVFPGNGREGVFEEFHGPQRLLFEVGQEGSPDQAAVPDGSEPLLPLSQEAHPLDESRLVQGVELGAHPTAAGSRGGEDLVRGQGSRMNEEGAVDQSGRAGEPPGLEDCRPFFEEEVGCRREFFEPGCSHRAKISVKNEINKVRLDEQGSRCQGVEFFLIENHKGTRPIVGRPKPLGFRGH